MSRAPRNRIVEHLLVKASDLVPHDLNYRKHPPRQKTLLSQRIDEVGYTSPLMVRRLADGRLQTIDGHLRAEIHPDELLPVDVVDLTAEEAKAELLYHDPLSALAETDSKILGDLIGQVESTGELEAWLKERAEDAGLDLGGSQSEEPPEIPPDRYADVCARWPVQTGEIWQLGSHRLLCGDSLSRVCVLALLGKETPALILADPPYGLSIVAANGYVGGGEAYEIPFGGKRGHVGGGESIRARTGSYPIESHHKKKQGFGSTNGAKPFGAAPVRGSDRAAHIVDVGKYAPIIGDDTIQTAKDSLSLCQDLYHNSVQVWWGANYYSEVLSPSACWLVWNKETTGNFADCELAWVNQNKAARLFTHRWNGLLRDSERDKRWHPTQKPAALASWVYGLFAPKGAIVFDPFGGAGWSLLAAEQSGYQARCIERSQEYCSVILERWHLMTGKTPKRVSSVDSDAPAQQAGEDGATPIETLT